MALDVFSIILSLLPIFYVISNHRYQQKLNLYFLGVCVSNILMIIGDFADWYFQTVETFYEMCILTVLTVVFYVASAFILYFFMRYIMEYLHLTDITQKIYLRIVRPVCMVQIVFAMISPFTGSFFYITGDGYQRGSLFMISQLVPLFCYILFMVLVVIYRKKLSKRETAFFLLYIFIPLSSGVAQMFLRGIAVINIGVTIALLLIFMNIQFEHEVVLRKQEKELTERRIDIMLSQIQPHFLYNTLGVIHHLCEEEPMKAKKMLKEFSEFLRGNMSSLKTREPIPFEKDLSHAMNYLYLEQQRFCERLHVVCKIQTTDFYIPPLTIQPLVENAVQHGIINKDEGGTVTISTYEMAKYAVVTIEDNGIGMEKSKEYQNLVEHTHIGIENVRSRLQEMVNGSLEIKSSDQGTAVTLRIPWSEV